MLYKTLKKYYNIPMKIITVPDPRLRQPSTKVNRITDETKEIVDQMIKASLEWEEQHPHELSAAMAAPQLGINKRIIIIRDDLDDKNNSSFTALIDPEVIKASGKIISDYEGCLSVPFIYGLVPRASKLRIKARTLAHESDHLDGVLFIDHIKDEEKAFFELDKDGDLKPLDYDKRIKNNPELFPDD